MAKIQDTDQFLVSKDGANYKAESRVVSSKLRDTDYMLVLRGSTHYKVLGKDIKSDLVPPGVAPEPSDVTASPAFEGGTGTAGDPYIITGAKIAPYGASVTSVQRITIQGEHGKIVNIFDTNTTANGSRFTQPLGAISDYDDWTGKLYYTDTPDSTTDTDYTGLLKIGNVYFSWVVQQRAQVAPVISSVDVVKQNPNGNRFTSEPFDVNVALSEDGLPAPTSSIKVKAVGDLRVRAETDTISSVGGTEAEPVIEFATNKNLDSFLLSDNVTQSGVPTLDPIVTTEAVPGIVWFKSVSGDSAKSIHAFKTFGYEWFSTNVSPTDSRLTRTYTIQLNQPITGTLDVLGYGGLTTVHQGQQAIGNWTVNGTRLELSWNGGSLSRGSVGYVSNRSDIISHVEMTRNDNWTSGAPGQAICGLYLDNVPLLDVPDRVKLIFASSNNFQYLKAGDTVSQVNGATAFNAVIHEINVGGKYIVVNTNSNYTIGATIKRSTAPSGQIKSKSATSIVIQNPSGIWGPPNTGLQIIGPDKVIASSTLYADVSSTGDITGMRNTDPGFTTWSPNKAPGSYQGTLVFPSTFPTGQTPDYDLPNGARLEVEVKAENTAGASTGSDSVTPTT